MSHKKKFPFADGEKLVPCEASQEEILNFFWNLFTVGGTFPAGEKFFKANVFTDGDDKVILRCPPPKTKE